MLRGLRVALGFLLVGSGMLLAEQPFETLPGFKTSNLLESRGIDNVNIYSGDPGIVLPLGPEYVLSSGLRWQLKAYYTSKFWHFDQSCPNGDPDVRHASVTGYSTLGAGWTLELGYVHVSQSGSSFGWVYRSPDGGVHPFYLISGNQHQTLDGTNLRLTVGSGTHTIEFTDGAKHEFSHAYKRPRRDPPTYNPASYDFTDVAFGLSAGNENTRYGLKRITDPFAQTLMEVDYLGAPLTTNAWKVSKIRLTPNVTPGREINYTWSTENVGGVTRDVVRQLLFTVAGGAQLTATFSHLSHGGFTRNAYDNSYLFPAICQQPPTLVLVPLLRQVELSAVTISPLQYQFAYLATGTFAGTLWKVTLPTSGTIEYTYGAAATNTNSCIENQCSNLELTAGTFAGVELPGGVSSPGADRLQMFMDNSAAVVTRTATDPTPGGVVSAVAYHRVQQVPTFNFPPYDTIETKVTRRVIVTSPTGHGTTPAQRAVKYLFHVGFNDFSFDSGLELVRKYYATENADDQAGGVPIRTHVSCYGDLPTPTCGYRDNHPANPIRSYTVDPQQRQRDVTWYGSRPTDQDGGTCPGSGPACSVAENWEFNASARRYRFNSVRSTLTGGIERTTQTDWIPNTSSWLLNMYWRQIVTESGLPDVYRRADFDGSTGYLRGTLLYDDPDATVNDRVSYNCRYDTNPARGVAATEFTATAAWDSGRDAVALNFCAEYWPSMPIGTIGINNDNFAKRHFYHPVTHPDPEQEDQNAVRHGLPYRTRWLAWSSPHGANRQLTWASFQVVRDDYTDWITRSTDAGGVTTDYTYDALGRLRTIAPQGEATTTITYDLPTQTTVSRSGAGNSTWEQYRYDGFGRLRHEIRQMPSQYAVRVRDYDAAGNAFYLSEWKTCSTAAACAGLGRTDVAGTTQSSFDPFSRPQDVSKPDGTTNTISYGDGSITFSDSLKTVTVKNLCVDGPGCTGGTQASTVYRYDVHGRLIKVTEPSLDVTDYSYDINGNLIRVAQNTGVQQARTFAHDAFSNLRYEWTPEKGAVNYEAYGSLGNLIRKTEGDGVTLSTLYDPAGRVACELQGATVKNADCTALGTYYVRNFYDEGGGVHSGKLTRRVGENPGLPVSITEQFVYAGLGGRLSQQVLTITGTPQGTLGLSQSWTYNSLGLVSAHTHPRVTGDPTDPTVTSSIAYTQGLPTSITVGSPRVQSVTYHPSGSLGSWVAGNNATTTITPDSSLLPRPASIATSGATANFSSGAYTYDGAGNIRTIGGDTFYYDSRSRLKNSTIAGQLQVFAYDRYGNRTPGTVSATNRLAAPATYDGRGNLTGHDANTYTYDALSRQTSINNGRERYLYSGAGERIARSKRSARFYPLAPCRLVDTRNPPGPYGGPILAGGTARLFTVTGACGVPANAISVSGNLTVDAPVASGVFTLSAAGTSPSTSTLNYNAAQVRANNFIVGLSAGGQVRLFTTQTAHALIDITGYFLENAAGESWTLTLRDEANRLTTEYTLRPTGRTRSRDYIYLGNLLAATREQGGSYLYYASDHLGSPRLVTDQAAVRVADPRYKAFGEELSSTGSMSQPLKFAQLERDATTSGNDYAHARYNMPSRGRFLSPDLLMGKATDPQSWNRYGYARANPIRYFDPNGAEWKSATEIYRRFAPAAAHARAAVAHLSRSGIARQTTSVAGAQVKVGRAHAGALARVEPVVDAATSSVSARAHFQIGGGVRGSAVEGHVFGEATLKVAQSGKLFPEGIRVQTDFGIVSGGSQASASSEVTVQASLGGRLGLELGINTTESSLAVGEFFNAAVATAAAIIGIEPMDPSDVGTGAANLPCGQGLPPCTR